MNEISLYSFLPSDSDAFIHRGPAKKQTAEFSTFKPLSFSIETFISLIEGKTEESKSHNGF